jgi:isopentenyldiphosphate isomerase
MELWDLYNEKRELIGKTHIRGEELPDDGLHLVVHVWIKNSDGKFLISQRASHRHRFPLYYE